MDLNELYKEIEKAEVDLNAKRLKYIKEALVENGGSIKLKFKEFKEFKDAGDATWLHQSCCCDHCVNHWGIDLCDCGSEHKVGECECGSQKAHDTLGIKYDSFGAILKNFG